MSCITPQRQTLRNAVQLLKSKLQFGDEKQLEAIELIRLAHHAREYRSRWKEPADLASWPDIESMTREELTAEIEEWQETFEEV